MRVKNRAEEEMPLTKKFILQRAIQDGLVKGCAPTPRFKMSRRVKGRRVVRGKMKGD